MTVQDKIQSEAVDKCLDFFKKNKKGHLNYGMRSGKTKISLEFLKKQYSYFPTILICYPNNLQQETWRNECILWNYLNHNITYCNFSSLWKYENKIFDVILIDEWHELSPLELGYAQNISNNDNITITLALSGTVNKETQQKWLQLKEIAKYTTIDGINDGILSDYKITVHIVELDNKIKYLKSKKGLITEKKKYDSYSFVMSNMDYKSTMFFHLALARNRVSISSIGKMNYLKKLLEQFKDKRCIVFCGLSSVADSIGIPSYHSKSKSDQNLQDFNNKKFSHLALVEQGGIGMTYKDLDCVILLNFVGNGSNTSQKLNRGIMLDYANKCSDFRILCINEKSEKNKLEESLSMLDKSKIKYIKN